MRYPVTPDGRYFVVRGRLWRMTNPTLPSEVRERLIRELMDARRAVGTAKRAGDADAERTAREAVDAAKHRLGERGPAWWADGAPDYNRRPVRLTPYAEWFAALAERNDLRSPQREAGLSVKHAPTSVRQLTLMRKRRPPSRSRPS